MRRKEKSDAKERKLEFKDRKSATKTPTKAIKEQKENREKPAKRLKQTSIGIPAAPPTELVQLERESGNGEGMPIMDWNDNREMPDGFRNVYVRRSVS